MSARKFNDKVMVAGKRLTQNNSSGFIIEDNIIVGKPLEVEESLNFSQTILRPLSEHPDFVGMIDAETGVKVTFSEMRDRSIRCALWLRKQGIDEYDVVGISTPIQMNDYVPYLATLYIDAIINSWHYDATPESVQLYFEMCRPKVMFACRESIDKLVKVAKDNAINCKFVAFERHEEHPSLEEIMAEQTQEEVDNFECIVPSNPRRKVSRILFTSGTTSAPKAVMHSYYSLVVCQGKELGMRSGMTCLWYSDFAWLTGCIFTLETIRLRCTRVVQREFDTENFGAVVQKYKIDFIFLIAYILTRCYQTNVFTRYDFEHVRVFMFGAMKTSKTVLEECRKILPSTFFRNVYGPTEMGGLVAVQTKSCKHIDSVGYVRSNVQLKVVDSKTGVALGPNQQGEIFVKTDMPMLGYLNNPEETKKTIDKEGWIRSGDLGFYDEDGEVFICDRMKSLIRTKLMELSSFDLEDNLMQHPHVTDCAVVGVEHPIDIERPFAFVVKAPDSKVTTVELIEFTASKNELYRLTGGLVFIDELPYTQTGKKCLGKLREMAKTLVKQQII